MHVLLPEHTQHEPYQSFPPLDQPLSISLIYRPPLLYYSAESSPLLHLPECFLVMTTAPARFRPRSPLAAAYFPHLERSAALSTPPGLDVPPPQQYQEADLPTLPEWS